METETGTELAAPKRRNKGFTLIELIIVIVILGILTTVVVLAVGGLRDEAEEVTCETDKETLETAIEAYLALNPTYAPTEQALIEAEVAKPKGDPTAYNISDMYEISTDGTNYYATPIGICVP